MFKNFLRKQKRRMTLIEMIIVIGLIGTVLWFTLSRVTNLNILNNEQNISGLLKQYVEATSKIVKDNIQQLNRVSYTDLFEKGDGGTNERGFVKLISNCYYDVGAFSTKEGEFGVKFKVAAVGEDLSSDLDIGPVDSIRSVLTKLGNWKMYFIAGKKDGMLNSAISEYNSIGDNIYVVLIEHQKASYADAYKGDTENRKYYNIAIYDSQGNTYDGSTSQTLLRSLIAKEVTDDGSEFNKLVELNDGIVLPSDPCME